MALFAEERPDTSRHGQLRALHWRVDAEVLRLYNFPAAIEQTLLELFSEVPRGGVPFEQKRYIPSGFSVQRLDDFLRITDEWARFEERRSELIDKKFASPLTEPERKELNELKRLFTFRRKVLMPFPFETVAKFQERIANSVS